MGAVIVVWTLFMGVRSRVVRARARRRRPRRCVRLRGKVFGIRLDTRATTGTSGEPSADRLRNFEVRRGVGPRPVGQCGRQCGRCNGSTDHGGHRTPPTSDVVRGGHSNTGVYPNRTQALNRSGFRAQHSARIRLPLPRPVLGELGPRAPTRPAPMRCPYSSRMFACSRDNNPLRP